MREFDSLCRKWGIPEVPPSGERRALVERLAASELFRKAPQQREIMLYLAARALTEAPGSVSEQEIACTVLGRGPDFDPGHDNIVRSQMRHLRQRLEEYFATEGAEEPEVLRIPKGSYIAAFEPRSDPQTARIDAAPPSAAPPPAPPRRGLAGRRAWLALLALLTLGSLLYLRGIHTAPSGYEIYRDILRPPAPPSELRVVLGNPVVMLYAGSPSSRGEEIGAADAIPIPPQLASAFSKAANRADKVMPHHLIQIRTHDYTGLGDALACFQLGRLLHQLEIPAELTQARFVNWDSARRHDLVIIGSPHTHDWADRNVPQHAYSIVKLGIQNRDPLPGEPGLYPCTWDSSGYPTTDYALIWAWKTAPGSRILVLAGPSSAATGAAATVFSDPAQFQPIHARLKAAARGGAFPSDWQVLLKVEVRDNIPLRTSYVTHRVYRSEL